MSKFVVAGDAVVVTSAVKFDDIVALKKYRPEALCLKDEEGRVIFKVGIGATGGVSDFGITFTSESNDDKGFAQVTIIAPDHDGDAKAAVVDSHFVAIEKLEKLEKHIAEELASVEEMKKKISESVSVVA